MRKRPKSRAEAKQATRVALIAAGIAEISHHGLEVSLDSICARAKLTRGAFYVHFADRDAFIVAVMQHVLGTFVSAITAQPTTIASAIAVFFAAARARSPAVHAGGGLRFHHLMEACRRSKVIGDTYRGLLLVGRDQLAALLDADQRAGNVRADLAAPALADVMLIAALGIATLYELELPLDVDRIGAALQRAVTAP